MARLPNLGAWDLPCLQSMHMYLIKQCRRALTCIHMQLCSNRSAEELPVQWQVFCRVWMGQIRSWTGMQDAPCTR